MEVIIDARGVTATQIRHGELVIPACGNRWILPSEEHLDWFLRVPRIAKLEKAGLLTIRKVEDSDVTAGEAVTTRSQFIEMAAEAGIGHRKAEDALMAGEVVGSRKEDGRWVIPVAAASEWIAANQPTHGEEE